MSWKTRNPKCHLALMNNRIAENGMLALAKALGQGALPSIEHISLFGNLSSNANIVELALEERRKVMS